MQTRGSAPDSGLPHCPDVAEREVEDGGFSLGWGFHMLTSERYWVDSHCHYAFRSAEDGRAGNSRWFDRLESQRLGQIVNVSGTPATLDAFAEVAQEPRFAWFIRLSHDDPNLDAYQRAVELGVTGLKLHNGPLISYNADYRRWEGDEWARVFAEVNRQKKPIVWHATQRVSASAYSGGALRSNWSEGWKNGVTFTNEDLLQTYLRLLRAYPDISFVGAHQLYLGLERLGSLFEEYPNFYVDTSVGCVVRDGDQMHPEDQALWRDFVIRYADRILFATDCGTGGTGALLDVNAQAFINHARFIRQLCLPDDVLQKVAWANAVRVYGLQEHVPPRRSNVRP
ncbi:MAG: amidohydrolase family protein [Armatimonadetes bacterium]|nr:amidohydrolase family protein [Armatimonadota bacterium]